MVRAVSARVGLRTSAKPQAACLASRIAYGDPVAAEAVHVVERAEQVLHRLGLTECRVRSHGNGTVARIEVPLDRIDEVLERQVDLDRELRGCGFRYVTVDLAGLRSGSMNALLPVVSR